MTLTFAYSSTAAAEAEEGILATPRHALPATPRTPPLRKQRSAFAEELPSSWEGTCEWVLATRLSLWDILLEPIFVQVSPFLCFTV